MYLADSHLHTLHSFDSTTPMQAQCEAALAAGFQQLCFTEHFSLNPKVSTYGHMRWQAYEADFAACAQQFDGRLVLRRGIELCEPHQPPQAYRALSAERCFDMVIGSVHNVREMKLRKLVATYGQQEAYRLYFDELLQMVKLADIDVVAHLDLIKRYWGQPFTGQDFDRHRPVLTEIFTVMAERGLALELNTSMLGSLSQISPEQNALALYAAAGGKRLTFGSDAHKPEHVGRGFAQSVEMAKVCGFSGFYTYDRRRPIFHPFDET